MHPNSTTSSGAVRQRHLIIQSTSHPVNQSSNLPIYGLTSFPNLSPLHLSPFANRCIDLDLATIIYTSGSTGKPKGVMSAHYNMVAAASSIIQYLENVEDDIILNVLPLHFDYGLYQVLMAFLFGGTVVLEKSFAYPYRIIERIVEEKITGFPIVPTIAALLLQIKELDKFDFSHIRYITNTADVLPVAYIRKMQNVFPHAKIFSMYGLTECKRVSYLPPKSWMPGRVRLESPCRMLKHLL